MSSHIPHHQLILLVGVSVPAIWNLGLLFTATSKSKITKLDQCQMQLCKPWAELRASGSHSNHIHFNERTNSLWARNCWVFFPENPSRMSSLGWLLRECFSTFSLQYKVMAPCFVQVLTGAVHFHILLIHIFTL